MRLIILILGLVLLDASVSALKCHVCDMAASNKALHDCKKDEACTGDKVHCYTSKVGGKEKKGCIANSGCKPGTVPCCEKDLCNKAAPPIKGGGTNAAAGAKNAGATISAVSLLLLIAPMVPVALFN